MTILKHGLHDSQPASGARHSDALVDSLLSSPLFVDVQREEVVDILSGFDEETFNRGHRITLQGLRGSDFFIVTDGHAGVRIDGRRVARLERGDFFGEVGVMSDGIRTATVEAETPLHCLVLPHRGLEALLIGHPQLGVNLLRGVLQRFRDVSSGGDPAR